MHYACLRLLTVLTASTSLNPTNEHSWAAPIFLASLQTQKQTGMIKHNNHNSTHFHCRVQLFKRIRTTGCKKFVSHIIRNNLKVHWIGKSVSKKLQTKMVPEIWSLSTVKQLWLVIILEMKLVGGGGVPHWPTQICGAEKGMFFRVFSGYTILPFNIWNRVSF